MFWYCVLLHSTYGLDNIILFTPSLLGTGKRVGLFFLHTNKSVHIIYWSCSAIYAILILINITLSFIFISGKSLRFENIALYNIIGYTAPRIHDHGPRYRLDCATHVGFYLFIFWYNTMIFAVSCRKVSDFVDSGYYPKRQPKPGKTELFYINISRLMLIYRYSVKS